MTPLRRQKCCTLFQDHISTHTASLLLGSFTVMSSKRARDDEGGESGSEEGPSKPGPCSLCLENEETDRFCRHQIDPKNRLYHQLTVGMHWTHDKAIKALNAYAEFLTLKVLEADFSATTIKLCPSDLIDQVWHAHVLDTAAYEACNEYMIRYVEEKPASLGANERRSWGHFIHYDPMGALDQESEARKKQATRTLEAYNNHFGGTPADNDEAWSFPILTGYHFVTFKLRDSQGSWVACDKCVRLDVPVASLIPDICTGVELDKLRIYDDPGESIPRLTVTLRSLQRIRKQLFGRTCNRKLQVCLMTEAEAKQRQTTPTTTVVIKNLLGKTFPIAVHLTPHGDTVEDLKELIQNCEGVPPFQQRLIVEGKQLQDHRHLSDYGITDGSVVMMILRLAGC